MRANNDYTSLYLLHHGANPGTIDEDGETPLISAVRNGYCLNAVNYIAQNSSEEVVNQGDDSYDESPIGWACESGQAEMVKILLAAKTVDPNRPATKWRRFTPLHMALSQNQLEVLRILLKSPLIAPSWDAADTVGRKPLEYALQESDNDCTLAILTHPHTTTQSRIEALKRFAKGDDRIEIIKGVLESIPDKELPTSELDDLIRLFPTFKANEDVFRAWMRRIDDPERWKELRNPLHELALMDEKDAILHLLEKGANIFSPDEDNWTCIDIADKNGHQKLKDRLVKCIPNPPPKKSQYALPFTLTNPFDETNVSILDCIQCIDNSQPCVAVKGNFSNLKPFRLEDDAADAFLEIKVDMESVNFEKICLRTQKCIPPDLAWFYFEVHLIDYPNGRYLAVGYTQVNIPEETYPGITEGSWAYHGDDGGLYVKSLDQDSSWSRSSQTESYKAGDVVGCGLNMKSGEGYRTLNGERLDSWGAFDDHKFKKGKIYPCIGLPIDSDGVGLHVRVVFDKSEEHSFMYRGPETQNFRVTPPKPKSSAPAPHK
ncbi:hypothetical protein N0V90_002022 [Kalmusia sp. IMI 367209]|nr:hypothetical protein N0V90_002022 [Kalmusia sp. IMI 367209]